MSTRPDTPFERNGINPYAPRWVRDPSYQVLRRAETLKRTALSPEETEPAPSVPCGEPDLPQDFPEFLRKTQQPEQDELVIDDICVPPSMRPKRPLEPDQELEQWPRRWTKKRRIGHKALNFTLAVSVAAGASYLMLWNSTDNAVDPAAQTVRASIAPAAIAPVEPPASTQVKTVRITPNQQGPWPATETAAPAPQQKPNISDPPAPEPAPQYRVASQAWEPLPASTPATPAKIADRAPETRSLAAVASAAPAKEETPTAAKLDEETIALLIKQGEQFISAGDFASARVVFRRAAEAGNREAALAMAGTYDPAALKRLGVKGLAPDPEQARIWYEKARRLGSTEAPQLLKRLANRTD